MVDTDLTDVSDETEIDTTAAGVQEPRDEAVTNEPDDLAQAQSELVADALDRFGPDDERRAEFDDEGRGPGEA